MGCRGSVAMIMGVKCQKKKPTGFVLDAAKVKLLLHFDNDFNDSSPNNVTVNNFGNVSISTDSPKFGVGKLQFGNSPRDGYLKTAAFFNFGNKRPFTLSFWAKSGDFNGGFVTTRDSPVCTPFDLSRGGTFLFGNSALNDWVFCSFSADLTNWTHIALVADGTRIKGYKNGIAQFDIAHPNWPSLNSLLQFGKNGDGNFSNGSLDDFLLYDGVLWTADFTPPTAPFTY